MRVPRVIREPLLRVAQRLGYEILKPNRDGSLYGPILPVAMYSPWFGDAAFLETYRAIQPHTLVDMYKCYELWSLVESLASYEGSLIEIGVWRGGSGALIAKRAQLCGILDDVFLCDTFRGVVKASPADPIYRGGEHSDTSEAHVAELLGTLGLVNAKLLRGVFPDETGASIANRRFRLCHIDVDVYQSAKEIVDWIWDKMVVGGVIVYDDYGIEPTAGITRFVNEQKGLGDRLTLYNLNGHAITVKTR